MDTSEHISWSNRDFCLERIFFSTNDMRQAKMYFICPPAGNKFDF